MWNVAQPIRRGLGRLAERTGLGRLHRDEAGTSTLEYGLILAAIVIPLWVLFERLFYVLSEYFGTIAFYVSWPFM
jgi:Flp pilus assembly pilin Flp